MSPPDTELLEQLHHLHEASPQMVALFDAQDRLRYANPAFMSAFHAEADGQTSWMSLMRANLAAGRGNIVRTADHQAWLAAAASRRGKLPFRAFEADLHDGRWIWMCETVDDRGWMLCVASDITHLRQDGRALRQERDLALRAAQTDALTGISNRAHVLHQLEQGLQRVREQGAQLAVVLLDLDHFKRINDSLGHEAGDQVIRDFARRLQQSSRRADGCGRYGGEEFMLLLCDVSAAEAQSIVERLLAQTRSARPLPQRPDFAYSSSAGLCMARPGDSIEQVCHRADMALYAAKAAGRDRCALAAGDDAQP
ncbi:diguanylate cyclase [Paucibacter sp. APW11]|uniref:diguanylate cyclase n=1 Tax=Roseateles aquae TaxID=3077235 RepID=A0ABU3P9W6_9BURK|nr:diguanylate cyclase [Paucibacter sp. APW11]MDT8999384.1 diguanylate cyclase [Paucibacter sp. APW11]